MRRRDSLGAGPAEANRSSAAVTYALRRTLYSHDRGEPFIWDRGRELGMTNRIDRIPA